VLCGLRALLPVRGAPENVGLSGQRTEPDPIWPRRELLMAKKSRMAVLKRQRELKKAEKAAVKAERRLARKELDSSDTPTDDDLAGYGLVTEEDEREEEASEEQA
jgi:hypothetical protein